MTTEYRGMMPAAKVPIVSMATAVSMRTLYPYLSANQAPTGPKKAVAWVMAMREVTADRSTFIPRAKAGAKG